MNYYNMSPMRLWQEADSLGWRLTKEGEHSVGWQPKPPEPMSEELQCAIKSRQASLRALLTLLEQEKPLKRWVR